MGEELDARQLRRQQLDRKYREAFFTVVEAYNQIKATIGSAPAIDYFKSQLGKAKYKCDISFMRVIDYTVDVEKTAQDYLDKEQLDFFKSYYIGQPDRSAVSDNNMMLMQKVLGKAFLSRKLWPLSTYFGDSMENKNKWCKHRLQLIGNKPGVATVQCTVCKKISIQTYKTAQQFEQLLKACKATRFMDRFIASKGTLQFTNEKVQKPA